MTKSLYKRPENSEKSINATPLQKTHSKLERKRRQSKIDKCKSLIATRVHNIRINHYCDLLKILKENHPKIYKKILSEIPILKTTKQMKLELYKLQYKEDGTSQIRGWIKKQIEKIERKQFALNVEEVAE